MLLLDCWRRLMLLCDIFWPNLAKQTDVFAVIFWRSPIFGNTPLPNCKNFCGRENFTKKNKSPKIIIALLFHFSFFLQHFPIFTTFSNFSLTSFFYNWTKIFLRGFLLVLVGESPGDHPMEMLRNLNCLIGITNSDNLIFYKLK